MLIFKPYNSNSTSYFFKFFTAVIISANSYYRNILLIDK